jgi:glucose-1-phosphate thymidylyltransferase
MAGEPESGQPEVIGLVPMAGRATRLAPLPFSKELYPIGYEAAGADREPRPKAVCRYVLAQMRMAGVRKAFLVLRSGKWDIPAYLGDGASLGLDLAYLLMRLPYGVPYTIDQAFAFVRHARIAFGFADIVYQPDDLYVRLLARQAKHKADVVLAIFPAVDPSKVSVVELDQRQRVVRIVEKPRRTDLRQIWAAAVWGPRFTSFLHDHLGMMDPDRMIEDASKGSTLRNDVPLSIVLQAAIGQGLLVEGEIIPDGRYFDIGTPMDLIHAARLFSQQP